jgi:HEAT repeat protein
MKNAGFSSATFNGQQPSAVVGPGGGVAADLPRLEKALQDKDPRARWEALEELSLFGPVAKPVIPRLQKLLEDPEAAIRLRAARTLATIAPQSSAYPTVLTEALQSPTVAVRRTAARAARDLGPDARPLVRELAKALGDSDAGVRWLAAEALAEIGPDAEPAVGALIDALKDTAMQHMAADALGSVGPKAKAAVPALQQAAKSANGEFQWVAALALVRIDPASAGPGVPAILKKLETNDAALVHSSLWLLEKMGPAAREAVPTLAQMALAGGNQSARAAIALSAIGGAEAERAAIPRLIATLAAGWNTSGALARFGAASVPALKSELANKSNPHREWVAESLALIGSEAKDAVPGLVAALRDEQPAVRSAAAVALKKIDPKEAAKAGVK